VLEKFCNVFYVQHKGDGQMPKIVPLQTTGSGQRKLGEAFRDFRKSQGMSLRAAESYVSDRTGGKISFTAIGDIERGVRLPDTNTLLLFAQSGYGGMSYQEMVDILTDRRLAVCESGGKYHA